MDENPEVIRQQMDDTRASLSEKLEALEDKVMDTVQGATTAVAATVDTVKETVQETVSTVKETVQDTVQTVRDTFDLPLQVRRHPWPMVGASVALGYGLGALLPRLEGARQSRRVEPPAPAAANYVPPRHEATAASANHRPTFLSKVSEAFASQIDKVQGLAVSALLGATRDALAQSLSGELGERVRTVLDDITTKLGGEPFQEPILPKQEANRTSDAEGGGFRYASSR
jgi:ElaB/YqjD/DUF883 family membrane-anchored ribosome-binding protein